MVLRLFLASWRPLLPSTTRPVVRHVRYLASATKYDPSDAQHGLNALLQVEAKAQGLTYVPYEQWPNTIKRCRKTNDTLSSKYQ